MLDGILGGVVGARWPRSSMDSFKNMAAYKASLHSWSNKDWAARFVRGSEPAQIKPLTPDQIHQAFGSDTVRNLPPNLEFRPMCWPRSFHRRCRRQWRRSTPAGAVPKG